MLNIIKNFFLISYSHNDCVSTQSSGDEYYDGFLPHWEEPTDEEIEESMMAEFFGECVDVTKQFQIMEASRQLNISTPVFNSKNQVLIEEKMGLLLLIQDGNSDIKLRNRVIEISIKLGVSIRSIIDELKWTIILQKLQRQIIQRSKLIRLIQQSNVTSTSMQQAGISNSIITEVNQYLDTIQLLILKLKGKEIDILLEYMMEHGGEENTLMTSFLIIIISHYRLHCIGQNDSSQ